MAERLSKVLSVAILLFLSLGTAVADTPSVESEADPEPREWRFRVLLDDKDIGYHSFRVREDGETKQVEIEASFDVRFLFFNAYSYRHNNVEQWRGNCLEQIQSTTRAGRDEFQVTGTARTDQFTVQTLDAEYALETDCARSFAYWDPIVLDSTRLLNSQTGDWIDVSVSEARAETLEIQGREVTANRYNLDLPDGRISLWYGAGGEWLALQAPAPGDRVLRYLPEKLPASFDLDTRVVSR